tara:strand:+ start:1936 stop:2787 length:852 start_codon:yes stop_codon:yes gene_type:complete
VYNRFEKTVKTIDSLILNKESKSSELHVFSDGPKTKQDLIEIQKIRNYISALGGFKKIFLYERESNLGLANSLISGINEVFIKSTTAIILEDDIVVTKYFLNYMNKSLKEFKSNKKIFSITGYSFKNNLNSNDVYVFNRFMSWGWATWKNRWGNINFNYSKNDIPFLLQEKRKINLAGEDLIDMYTAQIENRIDSWAVRFAVGQCLNSGLTIYPKYSLVDNIGFDEEATHTKRFNPIYITSLNKNFKPVDFSLVNNDELNHFLRKKFKKGIIQRLKNLIKKII